MVPETNVVYKAAKNSSIFFTGSVFQRLFSLLSAVILMRSLGDAGYGIFAYFLVIIGFSVLCIDMGMENILIREYAKDKQRGEDLLIHAFYIKAAVLSQTNTCCPLFMTIQHIPREELTI